MAETIAAIASAPGEAGIGIVKISGPASLDIMRRVMAKCPDEVQPRHAYLGRVKRSRADGGTDTIDQAIFLFMKGPASYTGEDVLEIQAHGSNMALRLILRAVFDCGAEGVRMAEPGEFTKLAFLNGKMDLSQAEAVIDIIQAKTELSLGIAESQHRGRLSDAVRRMRDDLLDILAEMAVNIDYPDEDEEAGGAGSNELAGKLRWVLADVEELLDTARTGRIAREGIRAAIVGKPNAGKSSLMNALLGEGRVIVTDIPGTTRDTVEESLSVNGIPLVLTDTAGLRETDDTIEKIGIEKTEQAIAAADMVILVLDGSGEISEEDEKAIRYIEKMDGRRVLAVINKEDLGRLVSEDEIRQRIPEATVIRTSLVGRAADEAARKVAAAVSEMFELGSIEPGTSNIVTSERQLRMLRNAEMNLDESISMLRSGEPLEVAELSARYAYDSLGKMIGEEAGEEILNTVFSRFCLGK